MENDFINEGMEFLANGKQSGRVLSFSDFLKESEQQDEPKAPEEAQAFQEYYKGTEDVDFEGGRSQNVHVFEFPTDELMDQFLENVGGMPHPLGGNRAVLSESLVTEGEAGYGDQPFFFAKNGDAGNYFFKMDEKGLVLTIGKFSKFTQPTEQKTDYGVLALTELPMEALDQAVMDGGKFEPNANPIELADAQISRALDHIAVCINDYVQKNPSVNKFYDELQSTVKHTDYDNKLALSITKWPGGTEAWKLQVIEKGKLNSILK